MIKSICIFGRSININQVTNPKLRAVIDQNQQKDSFHKSSNYSDYSDYSDYSEYMDNCYSDGGWG